MPLHASWRARSLASVSSDNVLTRTLETRFSLPRALVVGRAALGLAATLKCWAQGRAGPVRVAVPAAVCHEVIVAILAANCEPVWCDVDMSDGLTPESEWTRARAAGAEVALVVHLYGNAASVAAARRAFAGPECLLIDDAAQALSAHSSEGEAGALGDVGLLSFGHSKQISVGNAALVFRDVRFAARVEDELRATVSAPDHLRLQLTETFRSRFDAARAALVREGDRAAVQFRGLLAELTPVLHAPLIEDIEVRIVAALDQYAHEVAARRARAALWSSALAGTPFQAVGMRNESVPWRYVCRLPGATWARQHDLAVRLRKGGMDVSNWYLPAHWFLGHAAGSLAGVETLSREVFQFWLTERESDARIAACAQQIRRELDR
jgi:dTDP-4-amino-4,6-dideoxygalactose transaminase